MSGLANYTDIKQLFFEQYKYIALIDNNDNEIVRLLANSDARVTQTYNPSNDYIDYSVTISGDDQEISLPKTISKILLYRVATNGTAVEPTVNIAAVTLSNAAHQAVITLRWNIPESL